MDTGSEDAAARTMGGKKGDDGPPKPNRRTERVLAKTITFAVDTTVAPPLLLKLPCL